MFTPRHRLPDMTTVPLQQELTRCGLKIPIIFVIAHPDEVIRDKVTGFGCCGVCGQPNNRYGPLERSICCICS
jgi:hypothetical protein